MMVNHHQTDLRQTEVGLLTAVQSQFITTFAVTSLPFPSSRYTFTTLVLLSWRHTTIHKHTVHYNAAKQLRSSDVQN